MSSFEITTIIQELSRITGLSTLAIEIGFLLILTTLVLAAVFVLEAFFRIKKEMVKLSSGVGYIAHLLKIGIDKRKISQDHFDFRVEEWKEDTRFLVVAMLQQDFTDNEICNAMDVSKEYINEVRRWAMKKGILFKRVPK